MNDGRKFIRVGTYRNETLPSSKFFRTFFVTDNGNMGTRPPSFFSTSNPSMEGQNC